MEAFSFVEAGLIRCFVCVAFPAVFRGAFRSGFPKWLSERLSDRIRFLRRIKICFAAVRACRVRYGCRKAASAARQARVTDTRCVSGVVTWRFCGSCACRVRYGRREAALARRHAAVTDMTRVFRGCNVPFLRHLRMSCPLRPSGSCCCSASSTRNGHEILFGRFLQCNSTEFDISCPIQDRQARSSKTYLTLGRLLSRDNHVTPVKEL